jgi:hypothetical protein
VSPARVRAAVAAVRAGPPVAVTADVCLAVDDLLVGVGVTPADEEGEAGGEEEEDAVHDAEDPRGLEHGARLVGVQAGPAVGQGAEDTEAEGAGGVVRHVGAVLVGAAQDVDGADEGAAEAEVDEGDEDAVGARPVVGEEGVDGPGGAEHRHDEEDQDGVGREGVGHDVLIHEPGEHAEGGDLEEERAISFGGGIFAVTRAGGSEGKGDLPR